MQNSERIGTMRGKSHVMLGHYLADTYMPHIPAICQQAFLLGCVQPDRNPTTYLKGSMRRQWLRGHNYENALPFIERIARRLERKETLNLWDFYTAGKLIHYTVDAFTYAHNSEFPEEMVLHRQYEVPLQEHFLQYLAESPTPFGHPKATAGETIRHYHRRYLLSEGSFSRDSRYAFSVSCHIMWLFFVKNRQQSLYSVSAESSR